MNFSQILGESVDENGYTWSEQHRIEQIRQNVSNVTDAETILHAYKFYILFVEVESEYDEILQKYDEVLQDKDDVTNLVKESFDSFKQNLAQRVAPADPARLRRLFKAYRHTWVFIKRQNEKRGNDKYFRVDAVYFPRQSISARTDLMEQHPNYQSFFQRPRDDRSIPREISSGVTALRNDFRVVDDLMNGSGQPLQPAFLSGQLDSYMFFNQYPKIGIDGKAHGGGAKYNTHLETAFHEV
jgi:hypothetical protein